MQLRCTFFPEQEERRIIQYGAEQSKAKNKTHRVNFYGNFGLKALSSPLSHIHESFGSNYDVFPTELAKLITKEFFQIKQANSQKKTQRGGKVVSFDSVHIRRLTSICDSDVWKWRKATFILRVRTIFSVTFQRLNFAVRKFLFAGLVYPLQRSFLTVVFFFSQLKGEHLKQGPKS